MYRIEFQSTRPRGARHLRPEGRRHHGQRFNPRARVGRDVTVTGSIIIINVFQSTRPRGARPAGCALLAARTQRFNPRARVGRDSKG